MPFYTEDSVDDALSYIQKNEHRQNKLPFHQNIIAMHITVNEAIFPSEHLLARWIKDNPAN